MITSCTIGPNLPNLTLISLSLSERMKIILGFFSFLSLSNEFPIPMDRSNVRDIKSLINKFIIFLIILPQFNQKKMPDKNLSGILYL